PRIAGLRHRIEQHTEALARQLVRDHEQRDGVVGQLERDAAVLAERGPSLRAELARVVAVVDRVQQLRSYAVQAREVDADLVSDDDDGLWAAGEVAPFHREEQLVTGQDLSQFR